MSRGDECISLTEETGAMKAGIGRNNGMTGNAGIGRAGIVAGA
jgi:hypothetical protein